uniref:C-type lectin domain-containing protein n=1 Tax=Panagrellus redivivus TaxID=6233 RepID=A0A7E5A1B8_PANRE
MLVGTVIGSLLVLTFIEAQDLQPCPENPITLTGSDYPQYVYSPYNERQQYPPNTDCRFILTARDRNRRISVNVLRSELEEPIFTDCTDYVSVRDGGLPTSTEIVRWCGADYPSSFTSLSDSVYIHFHSDNVIERRGFNLSFTDYSIPGCPPNWIHNTQEHSCYQLFTPMYGYTWIDAQRACNYDRANLLTISNQNEYTYILNTFNEKHIYSWVGYTDADEENIFEAVDPKIPLWPENFPTFKKEHLTRDCVFFDWNIRDGIAYSIDDCRNKHSFICKKADDGSTTPMPPPVKLIRKGIEEFGISGMLWLLIIILALIVLLIIILLLVYKQYRKHYSNRIANVDQNQRLVTMESGAATVVPTNASKSEAKTTHSKVTTISGSTSKQDHHRQSKHSLRSNKDKKRSSKSKHETTNHEGNSHANAGAFNTESESGSSPRFHMSSNQPHPVTSYTTSVAKVPKKVPAPDVQKIDLGEVAVESLGNAGNTNGGAGGEEDEKAGPLPAGVKSAEHDNLDDKNDSDASSTNADQNQAGGNTSTDKKHEEQISKGTASGLEGQRAIITEVSPATRSGNHSGHQHERREATKQIPIENTSVSSHAFTSAVGASASTKHGHIVQDASTVTDPVHGSVQSEDFDGIQMSPMNPHTQKKRRSHIHILNNVHAKTADEMWEQH